MSYNHDGNSVKPPETPGDDIKFYEPGDLLPTDIVLESPSLEDTDIEEISNLKQNSNIEGQQDTYETVGNVHGKIA